MDDLGFMIQCSKAVWGREYLKAITFGDASYSESISHSNNESESNSHHMKSGYGCHGIQASVYCCHLCIIESEFDS